MFATFSLPRPSNIFPSLLVVLLPRGGRLLLSPDPHQEWLQLSFVQFLVREREVGGQDMLGQLLENVDFEQNMSILSQANISPRAIVPKELFFLFLQYLVHFIGS